MFKNARKIILGASLALIMGMSVVGVNAEEPAEVKNQETEINISVKDGEIEKPGDGGDGGDGNPEAHKGKLAIWLKPTTMNFAGTYSEVADYKLDLQLKEDGHGETLDYRRLAIADVRANESQWGLKANLTDLQEKDGKNRTISSGYTLSMKPTLGKYKVNDDGTVDKDTILKDSNGVEAILSDDRIVIDKSEKLILKAEKTDENERPGKGYSTAKLEDIKMNFEAAQGLAGEFSGKVKWTLTDTPQ